MPHSAANRIVTRRDRASVVPAQPDLSSVPMTPVMEELHFYGALLTHLSAAHDAIRRTWRDPVLVAAWNEGQKMTDMARVHHRQPRQTSSLYEPLHEQGIDTKQGRERLRAGLREMPLPQELKGAPREKLERLRAAVDDLLASFQDSSQD